MTLPTVDLAGLGFDAGAHILVRLALDEVEPGSEVGVVGTHPELLGDLTAWCRSQGHTCLPNGGVPGVRALVRKGRASVAAWVGSVRAGSAAASDSDAVAAHAPPSWGLAARGAAVEPGGPEPEFRLAERDELWTDRAAALYAQAIAAQWDPATAIDWDEPITHSVRMETAVVQLMTFLIENEEAALVVPARDRKSTRLNSSH